MTRQVSCFSRIFFSMALFGLGGCSSVLVGTTQEVAGLAGTGIATSVTHSATVAAGIGLGVAAVATAGLQYEERHVHSYEQDRIAEAAGTIGAGAAGPWSVSHSLPIESDEHGQVAVVRAIGGPSIDCKEIVFSVDTEEHQQPQRAFYTATVCRDGGTWKWASAEPATERWGSLQ